MLKLLVLIPWLFGATIETEMAGLSIGSPISKAFEKYGNPIRLDKQTLQDNYGRYVFNWGNGLFIYVSESCAIRGIGIASLVGSSSPIETEIKDVYVGMPEAQLYKVLGNPNRQIKENGRTKLVYATKSPDTILEMTCENERVIYIGMMWYNISEMH
jgi:hypothetical protein